MRYFILFMLFTITINVIAQDGTGRSPKGKLTIIDSTPNRLKAELEHFNDELLINIPTTRIQKNNAVAVIIGNKDYVSAPKVDYAINDAKVIKEYVIKSLGYKPENIIYVEDAKQSDLYTIFGKEGFYKGKLYSFVQKGLSEIFIYYSGHGAPDIEQKSGYLVPVDCDPNTVVLNGYALNTLYTNLDKIALEKQLPHVTIVLESCFSGNSQAGSLLKNISPIYISVEKQGLTYEQSTIFTSSQSDQISTWYPEKQHGMFTYFFVKGLQGNADVNGDGKITAKELYDYTNDDVSGIPYWVSRINLGRTQNPMLIGKDYYILEK
ncbi:MAG: caspase family protein [bacterium]